MGGSLTIATQTRTILSVESATRLTIDSAFDQIITHETYLIKATSESAFKVGSGTVSSTRDRAFVTGCRTRFQQDVEIGDELLFLDSSGAVTETRTVTAIESDTVLKVDSPLENDRVAQTFLLRRSQWIPVQTAPQLNTRITALIHFQNSGTGTITSTAEQITGQKTQFTKDFAVGDSIAIQTASAVVQTRKIVEIRSDTDLKIHAAFDADLTQPTAYIVTGMLAATAGNGIIRSTDGGKQWKAVNQGLANLDVRSIAKQDGNLFAGTFENGVFRSLDRGLTWTGGDPTDPEIRQTGLTVPNITSFAINPLNRDIFAGTTDGVFRSRNAGASEQIGFADRWMLMKGLPQVAITPLSRFT